MYLSFVYVDRCYRKIALLYNTAIHVYSSQSIAVCCNQHLLLVDGVDGFDGRCATTDAGHYEEIVSSAMILIHVSFVIANIEIAKYIFGNVRGELHFAAAI